MTQLEQAAKAVAEVFNKYAGQDAEKDMLSKEELKALLQAEIPRLVDLEELLTGDGQTNYQSHKLLKVHLPVSVLIQILHDLIHRCWVLLAL
ncbi:UNVERIFIED_CONTAM: hypothetical protein FKN15_041505 [Acipenser sinensis]